MRMYTFILAAFLTAGIPLRASVVTVALDTDTITLGPGSGFTFDGLIINTTQSTIDLNGIDITLDGSLFQVDPSPFFSGPPVVEAGLPTLFFPLFSVTVDLPYDAPAGIQMGTLTILGGVEVNNVYDPTVEDVLGSVPFTVNVVATPEPSSFTMLSTAIVIGIVFLWRRRGMWKGGVR